jgi:hypothetical protein
MMNTPRPTTQSRIVNPISSCHKKLKPPKENKHTMYKMKENTEAYPTSSRTEAAMAMSITVAPYQQSEGESELIDAVQSSETEGQAKFIVTWANVFVVPEKTMARFI